MTPQQRPIESDYTSLTAYTRALEEYCDELAQPEQDNTYAYASSLAKTIWQKHYIKESPKFALLDTTEGVLTQIDNMTCGLVREKPAQPEPAIIGTYLEKDKEQAPVAWANPNDLQNFDMKVRTNGGPLHTVPLYTTPPQLKPLTDEEIKAIWLNGKDHGDDWLDVQGIARAIEAAHNIKEES